MNLMTPMTHDTHSPHCTHDPHNPHQVIDDAGDSSDWLRFEVCGASIEPRQEQRSEPYSELRYGIAPSEFGDLFVEFTRTQPAAQPVIEYIGIAASSSLAELEHLPARNQPMAERGRGINPVRSVDEIREQRNFGQGNSPPHDMLRDDAPVKHLWTVLRPTLLGEARGVSGFRLRARGSAFQVSVWQQLARIETGKSLTYGELASRAGYARSYSRAVGGAVGKNPLSMVIPCHRVVPSGGGFGNYAWGGAVKQALCEFERRGSQRAA